MQPTRREVTTSTTSVPENNGLKHSSEKAGDSSPAQLQEVRSCGFSLHFSLVPNNSLFQIFMPIFKYLMAVRVNKATATPDY